MTTINMQQQNRDDDRCIAIALCGNLSDAKKSPCPSTKPNGKFPPVGDEIESFGNSDAETFSVSNPWSETIAIVDLLIHRQEQQLGNQTLRPLSQFQRETILSAFQNEYHYHQDIKIHNVARDRNPAKRRINLTLVLTLSVCMILGSFVWLQFRQQFPIAKTQTLNEQRIRMFESPPVDLVNWQWIDVNRTETDPTSFGNVIWSDVQQKGFARFEFPGPVADSALYQLLAFIKADSVQSNDSLDAGLLCCEFRFEQAAKELTVELAPRQRLSRPRHFAVRRAGDREQATISGPSLHDAINLIASPLPNKQVATDVNISTH